VVQFMMQIKFEFNNFIFYGVSATPLVSRQLGQPISRNPASTIVKNSHLQDPAKAGVNLQNWTVKRKKNEKIVAVTNDVIS